MGVRIRLPNTAELDVYHTHLDAGSFVGSIAARGKQLDTFAEAVEKLSPTQAVIIGGDFNASFSRPEDRELLLKFRQRLGLTDSGAAPQLPWWRERDYILFRNGPHTQLNVVEAGEALEFVVQSRALSDHPALFARFNVTPIP
ncbi:MAG: endonuclease/exonuclease/phosphatase family protein [Nitrospirota bacterium]